MNNRIIIALLCAASVLGACDKNLTAELTLDTEIFTVPAEGGHFRLGVTASSATKSHVEYSGETEDWIHLLPSVLKGNGILEVNVDSYDYVLSDRRAVINVVMDDMVKTVEVVQMAKPGLTLGVRRLIGCDSANEYAVSVASSGRWTASVSEGADSWISFVKGAGEQGEGELVLSLSAVESYSTRRDAVIKVSAGSLSEELSVSQGYGVLIGGKLWAKCDVGEPNRFTASPEVRGLLYQYDKKIGFPSIQNDMTTPVGFETTAYAGGDTWSDANNPCPAGWRVPTAAEAEALIGTNNDEPKKFKWGWWYAEQGAYVGTVDAASAGPEDPKGCIFLPMSGYRDWQDGYEKYWASTFIQTVTRPGHNWGRVYYQVHWDNQMYKFNQENNAAFPVRCVADMN